MLVSQLCPTLCNPMDCSLPGSSAHRILQARILEWVAILIFWGTALYRLTRFNWFIVLINSLMFMKFVSTNTIYTNRGMLKLLIVIVSFSVSLLSPVSLSVLLNLF